MPPSDRLLAWLWDSASCSRWPTFSGMARISESNQSRPLFARLTGKSVRTVTIYRRDGSRREVAFAVTGKAHAAAAESASYKR